MFLENGLILGLGLGIAPHRSATQGLFAANFTVGKLAVVAGLSLGGGESGEGGEQGATEEEGAKDAVQGSAGSKKRSQHEQWGKSEF
jgi:hypothetical protein